MRFRCHLRSWIHPQHPDTHHPCLSTPRLVALEFALHPLHSPLPPPACHHRSCAKDSDTHPPLSQHESWQGLQCNAKASAEKSCVNNRGHPSYFSKALWSFCRKHFTTVYMRTVCYGEHRGWNMDIIIGILLVQSCRDQVPCPTLHYA